MPFILVRFFHQNGGNEWGEALINTASIRVVKASGAYARYGANTAIYLARGAREHDYDYYVAESVVDIMRIIKKAENLQ